MVQFFNAFGVDVFKLAFQIVNFLLLLFLLNRFLFKPVTRMLDERSERIRQGIHDAEAAHQARAIAEEERLAAVTDARREAREIIDRAQKAAQEARDADIAATRQELERMRTRAAAEIEAEKEHALAELRAEVASLALDAAGRVVRETMTSERQHRLVADYLAERSAGSPAASGAPRAAGSPAGPEARN